MTRKTPGLLLLAAVLLLPQASFGSDDTDGRHGVRRVRCDRGETITQALRSERSPLVIEFEGTCSEHVQILRDDVTLRGVGSDPTLIGKVSVIGSDRVSLETFTVENSFESGIDFIRSAGGAITGVVSQDNPRRCIYIEGASVDITDTSTFRCQIGIFNRSGHVNFIGTITSNENSVAGISASTGGSFVILNGNIVTNNNFLGYVNQLSAETTFANGSLTANNNTSHGISLTSQGVLVHGTINVTSTGNGGFGLFVVEGSTWSSFINFGSTTTLTGNAAGGALIAQRSTIVLDGAATVTGNGGFGLLVDESSLNLATTTINSNPAGSILLNFTSTATYGSGAAANTVTPPVICDSSSRARGPVACNVIFGPTAAAAQPPVAVEEILRRHAVPAMD